MNVKQAIRCASAASLALVLSTAYAGGESQPMTGKQKATAIGATTGAVAGAVVGGPVGAAVGGVAGGVIGHQGTDAQGRVTSTPSSSSTASSPDSTVRSAQAALETQGYSPGAIDGQMGPNTRSALVKFQQDKGLTPSGTLDNATLAALGVK
jgi:phage tail tape-measure protein